MGEVRDVEGGRWGKYRSIIILVLRSHVALAVRCLISSNTFSTRMSWSSSLSALGGDRRGDVGLGGLGG